MIILQREEHSAQENCCLITESGPTFQHLITFSSAAAAKDIIILYDVFGGRRPDLVFTLDRKEHRNNTEDESCILRLMVTIRGER